MLDQHQTIVAEEHLAIDEHRGRAEAAARDQLLGIDAQLVLVLGRGDLFEKLVLVQTGCAHDVAQDLVAAEVAVLALVGLEEAARVRRNLAVLLSDERSAHRLDRVHRENRGMADF
jgi:hypothetical protein